MAVSLTHTFQSSQPDGTNASLVQASNWNAEHTLTCATQTILGRETAGTGAVEELGLGAGLSIVAGNLVASTSAAWGGITGTLSAQADLQAALDAKQAAGSYQPLATVLTNTTAAFTTAQETKLAGIATAATANATDADLRDRATHTGAQAIATVTGLQASLDAKVDDSQISAFGLTLVDDADASAARTTLGLGTAATLSTADVDERARDAVGTALVAGANITITINDAGDTITIAATGVIQSGTSFPGSPSDGQRYYRTDLSSEWEYDTTAAKWLSVEIFNAQIPRIGQVTVSTNNYVYAPELVDYDLWVESWQGQCYRTAAGEWDIQLFKVSAADVSTSLATFDGAGLASTVWSPHDVTINALVTKASTSLFRIQTQEISGTAGFEYTGAIRYRLAL